ncbi:MAG: T9SS type A sorting domain-containing protein [Chitinophagales bacterium]
MKQLYTYLLLVTTSLMANASASGSNATWQPFGFWENKGQVVDQDGLKRSDVLYLFEQNGFTVALGKDFFSFQLSTNIDDPLNSADLNAHTAQQNEEQPADYKTGLIKYERTDIKLLGANKNAEIAAYGASDERRNYYGPAGTSSAIHHYQKIVYKNIYPGIDLAFYIESSNSSKKPRLKYDFIVHAGADARTIQLSYAGAATPTINDNGELVSLFPQTGFIKESKPLCYFEAASDSFFIPYQSAGSTISFKSVKAKNNRRLTIDPEISWSLYLGGNKDEFIEVLEVDGLGNIYCCGQTFSSSGIVTSGAYQTIKNGVSDCFIAKLNQSGGVEWCTYFGGEQDDFALGMCLDGFGGLYVCGQSNSLLTIATADAYQTSNGGVYDGFISKFDTTGFLIWSTFFGGSGKDQAFSCIADQSGLYVGGYTESAEHIATSGAQQTTYAGAGDAFIAAFTPAGAIKFSTYLGGSDQDRAHDVHLDHFGNLMVAGTTPSSDGIALGNVHQSTVGGNNDVFVAKYSKTGIKKWCTYYGGSRSERGREIITDGYGYIYVTGPTASGLNMATNGVYQSLINGTGPSTTFFEDAFLAKFDSTGKLVWGTYFGGANDEIGSSIKWLSSGLIVIGGTTLSDNFISTPDAYQATRSGKGDAFAAIFTDQGQLTWSSYYGGPEDEIYDDGYGPAFDIYDNRQLIFGISTFSPGLGTINNYTPSTTSTPATDALIVNIDLGCLDKYEPNNVITKPYKLGTVNTPVSLDALINYTGDKDFFTFTKTSDKAVKIYLSNLAQNCDLILYDSLYHPVKTSHHQGLGDEELTIKTIFKGKLYLSVFSPGTAFSGTCYHLSIKKADGLVKQDGNYDAFDQQLLSIYPNPAHNEITIYVISALNQHSGIRITDIMGRVVFEQPLTLLLGENQVDINLQNLPAGTYFVKVMNSEIPIQKLMVNGE